MITIIDLFIVIGVFLFSWINSFLLHEWMHIKSQGFTMTGHITVGRFGMTCSPDITYNAGLKRLAGGLYSGVCYIITSIFAFYYDAWALYVPFSMFGMINIGYGLWEW